MIAEFCFDLWDFRSQGQVEDQAESFSREDYPGGGEHVILILSAAPPAGQRPLQLS